MSGSEELKRARPKCQLKKMKAKMPKTDKPNVLIIWSDDIGWYSVCGAITGTPHAKRLAALPSREHYAAMELWRGTMTRTASL